MPPASRNPERMAELKLRKLLDANARLKQQLEMPRIPVSEASMSICSYAMETHDTLVPSVWGHQEKHLDPYAPLSSGPCQCSVM